MSGLVYAQRKKSAVGAGMAAGAVGGTLLGGGIRANLRGTGYAAGRAMLQPRGGAPVRGPQAGAVPRVVNIGRIPDPVNRNHAINQSYHAFDTAMTGYLGSPLVSNWCTYGQHASREAGTQIRNLQAGLQTMREAGTSLTGLAISANPWTLYTTATTAGGALSRVVTLLGQPGMVQQALNLALTKAGITGRDLRSLSRDWDNAATITAADLLVPGKQIYETLRLANSVVQMGIRLAAATPAIIAALQKIYGNMCKGNRQIYENIAPAYATFLQAANAAPNGVVGPMTFENDPSGYVSAAFALYSECRGLANEIAALPPGNPERALKIQQRNQKAHQANLLIGYQEQLVILQPIFDTMQQELRAMSGTMVLNDPNGAHALTGNWGDFYTRMGIDASRAPRDPTTVRPDNLPPLRANNDPKKRGTIADYFEQGLTNRRIHNAPPRISPLR